MKQNKEVGWIFGLLAIGVIVVAPFMLVRSACLWIKGKVRP